MRRCSSFIRETKFERLGVFTYSQEEGTRAGKMAGQIPDKVKQQRRDLAMAAQHAGRAAGRRIVCRPHPQGAGRDRRPAAKELRERQHQLLGTRPDPRAGRAHRRAQGPFLVARGEADAPDIDGRVYVRGQLPLGEFARVKIIGHTDYDLIAESSPGSP